MPRKKPFFKVYGALHTIKKKKEWKNLKDLLKEEGSWREDFLEYVKELVGCEDEETLRQAKEKMTRMGQDMIELTQILAERDSQPPPQEFVHMPTQEFLPSPNIPEEDHVADFMKDMMATHDAMSRIREREAQLKTIATELLSYISLTNALVRDFSETFIVASKHLENSQKELAKINTNVVAALRNLTSGDDNPENC